MKLFEVLDTEEDNLYVVTKTARTDTGPFRHGPMYQKGEQFRVVGVDGEGNASLTTPNGERIGITIPMEILAKV